MFCSPMERHTARENAVCFAPYRERLIQRILQLYGAIHATRIVTPCSRHQTAIQRYTALYAHTAIHRYTLYSPMQHPSGPRTPLAADRRLHSPPPSRAMTCVPLAAAPRRRYRGGAVFPARARRQAARRALRAAAVVDSRHGLPSSGDVENGAT